MHKSWGDRLGLDLHPRLLDHRDSGLYRFLKDEMPKRGKDLYCLNIKEYIAIDKLELLAGLGLMALCLNRSLTAFRTAIHRSQFGIEPVLLRNLYEENPGERIQCRPIIKEANKFKES